MAQDLTQTWSLLGKNNQADLPGDASAEQPVPGLSYSYPEYC